MSTVVVMKTALQLTDSHSLSVLMSINRQFHLRNNCICLSFSVCVYVCLYICLFVSICLSACLSVCLCHSVSVLMITIVPLVCHIAVNQICQGSAEICRFVLGIYRLCKTSCSNHHNQQGDYWVMSILVLVLVC